jgi:hypothetical protein
LSSTKAVWFTGYLAKERAVSLPGTVARAITEGSITWAQPTSHVINIRYAQSLQNFLKSHKTRKILEYLWINEINNKLMWRTNY